MLRQAERNAAQETATPAASDAKDAALLLLSLNPTGAARDEDAAEALGQLLRSEDRDDFKQEDDKEKKEEYLLWGQVTDPKSFGEQFNLLRGNGKGPGQKLIEDLNKNGFVPNLKRQKLIEDLNENGFVPNQEKTRYHHVTALNLESTHRARSPSVASDSLQQEDQEQKDRDRSHLVELACKVRKRFFAGMKESTFFRYVFTKDADNALLQWSSNESNKATVEATIKEYIGRYNENDRHLGPFLKLYFLARVFPKFFNQNRELIKTIINNSPEFRRKKKERHGTPSARKINAGEGAGPLNRGEKRKPTPQQQPRKKKAKTIDTQQPSTPSSVFNFSAPPALPPMAVILPGGAGAGAEPQLLPFVPVPVAPIIIPTSPFLPYGLYGELPSLGTLSMFANFAAGRSALTSSVPKNPSSGGVPAHSIQQPPTPQ